MKYLAYGSNLHPLRLKERVPSALLIGTHELQGFELRFIKIGMDNSGKCSILPKTDSSVFVAVYEIEPVELLILDRYEDLGIGYDRLELTIPKYGDCFTYIVRLDAKDESLKPYDWYRQLVLDGCLFHNFPDDYISNINNLEAIEDKNIKRRDKHLNLIKRFESYKTEIANWVIDERENILDYLSLKGCKHNGVPDMPTWYCHPLGSLWHVHSKNNDPEFGWWAITGDVPDDIKIAEPEESIDQALQYFSQLWMGKAEKILNEDYSFIDSKTPLTEKTEELLELAELYRNRAEQLMRLIDLSS